MKRNLLWTLLVIGITVSAFGAYYLHETISTFGNNQLQENEHRGTAGSSEKTEPDSPDKAHLWRMLAWRDENGRIPPNPISEALKQRDRYLKQIQQYITPLKADRSKRVSDELLGVALMNWDSKGPQNVGGRTRSIVIHPNNPDIIWAGSVGGGVWKSSDGGQSWFAMNGNLQNFAISSMAIDPNNPNILYAGTGEGFFNGDALRGDGIFKTTDGGMTWNQISSTVGWYSVDRISIAHNDSNKILIGTSGGTKVINNVTIQIPGGIKRSTEGDCGS
ncbi:hypothetical protein BH20ACI1_BH20ACI1_00630 [soil metagenome]